eukprot:763688-Amphidinium_carterae.1
MANGFVTTTAAIHPEQENCHLLEIAHGGEHKDQEHEDRELAPRYLMACLCVCVACVCELVGYKRACAERTEQIAQCEWSMKGPFKKSAEENKRTIECRARASNNHSNISWDFMIQSALRQSRRLPGALPRA